MSADNSNMKRLFVSTVALLLMATGASFAQSAGQQPSLADVARAEEARRKTAKKATLVITNANLAAGEVSSTPAGSAPSTSVATPAPAADDPGDKPADAGPRKDQKYWQERISGARTELSRSQIFADSLQSRINSLKNDIFNLDYPARGVAEKQLNAATAEFERLKKELEQKTKAITAIEEEARRAGVPPGWLRQ